MGKTEGKQLNAKIELLNGPNNVKQEYEVFTNNGELNSLFVVFDMPVEGYAIRVKNLALSNTPVNSTPKLLRLDTARLITNTITDGKQIGIQFWYFVLSG